ncbi:MAG: sigma-70 family RNA polymerase sigma factor [Planctomycetes bacterium]|nr:sigma-70 family RNA polymerase sigma factor [Planctomycetota bacterium]
MSDPSPLHSGGPKQFPPTHVSMLQRAREGSGEQRNAALDEFARAYWWPLLCFLRRSGEPEEDARDVVQGFFVALLERNVLADFDPRKGRFRTFLLACLKGHWSDQRDRRRAKKRGGGKRAVSLSDEAGQGKLDVPGKDLTPEEAYNRAWASAKVAWAVAQVRRTLEARDERKALEILEAYVHVEDLARPGTAAIAEKTSLPQRTVRHLFEYVRKEIKRSLLEQLREETGSPEEAQDELALIFRCLSHG